MDRREFMRTCSFALIGVMLPKTVIGETIRNVKRNLESTLVSKEKNETPESMIFTKKIREMAGTPLEMNGIYKKDSLRQFLGLNQYETIFNDYNKEKIRYKKDGKIDDSKESYLEEELMIPRIYDELREYYPENLKEYSNQNPDMDMASEGDLVIVSKVGNGRFALAFYKDFRLFLATHISPGKVIPGRYEWIWSKKQNKMIKVWTPPGEDSPSGTFRLNKRSYEKYRKSKKFRSAPMPYAINVKGGVFLHHGQNVDGNKKSHGCIRVPGFYQEELYGNLKSGTKMIIRDTDS